MPKVIQLLSLLFLLITFF